MRKCRGDSPLLLEGLTMSRGLRLRTALALAFVLVFATVLQLPAASAQA